MTTGKNLAWNTAADDEAAELRSRPVGPVHPRLFKLRRTPMAKQVGCRVPSGDGLIS